jgi:hypothetical protein
MALPNRYWLYNNSANDGVNSGNASGGAGGSSSNWVVIDLVNDALLFLDNQQMDGDSSAGTKYAVIRPESGSLEAPKTFVKDNSAAIYDQVPLAGTTAGEQSGGNTRYVFAIYFDGSTAGIPYLEAWDDSAHNAILSDYLGAGTPASSTIKAVSTTDAVPGSATWAGTPLAGTSSRVELDNAPLAGAQNVYFNIKQVIPYTFPVPVDLDHSGDEVLALRFLYS